MHIPPPYTNQFRTLRKSSHALIYSQHQKSSVQYIVRYFITMTKKMPELPPESSHELWGWNCGHISLALCFLQMLKVTKQFHTDCKQAGRQLVTTVTTITIFFKMVDASYKVV